MTLKRCMDIMHNGDFSMDLRFPRRFVLNVLTSSVLVGIPGKHLKIDLTIVCETKHVSRLDDCWLANAVRKNDCKKNKQEL